MRRSLEKTMVLAASLLSLASVTCSQGEGEGRVTGTLDVPNCWAGAFELSPDFFAGNPFKESFQIRIQRGSDVQNFSDGVSILLYDSSKVRPDPKKGNPGQYGVPLDVALPPEVTPPGVPIVPDPDPANVSLTLSLQRSCRVETATLHAVEQVALLDGACDAPAVKGADPTSGCAPDVESPAGSGTGRSLVSFTSVANGNLTEPTAAEKLTSGCFDVYLADPREIAPGGTGGPPRCRGHLKGKFSFFFERGRPSQPFP